MEVKEMRGDSKTLILPHIPVGRAFAYIYINYASICAHSGHWDGPQGASHGGSEKPGKLEVGGASRDSTGLGALEEGLISS